jgi:alpha-tubulin suppressor-like RCC1 family protein
LVTISEIPTQVTPPVVDVAVGSSHTIVLTKDDGVYVWGWNEDYQLGLGDQRPWSSPHKLKIPGSFPVVQVKAGNSASFVLTKDGSLYSWGHRGASGHGKVYFTPAFLFWEPRISEIACSDFHVLVLIGQTSVRIWGSDNQVVPGLLQLTTWILPKKFNYFEKRGKRIAQIGAGSQFSWAITESGSLYFWGSNHVGQFGFPIPPEEDPKCPTKFPVKKFIFPRRHWPTIFQWIFLGHSDKNSFFSKFPIEIIFNFVEIQDNFTTE